MARTVTARPKRIGIAAFWRNLHQHLSADVNDQHCLRILLHRRSIRTILRAHGHINSESRDIFVSYATLARIVCRIQGTPLSTAALEHYCMQHQRTLLAALRRA